MSRNYYNTNSISNNNFNNNISRNNNSSNNNNNNNNSNNNNMSRNNHKRNMSRNNNISRSSSPLLPGGLVIVERKPNFGSNGRRNNNISSLLSTIYNERIEKTTSFDYEDCESTVSSNLEEEEEDSKLAQKVSLLRKEIEAVKDSLSWLQKDHKKMLNEKKQLEDQYFEAKDEVKKTLETNEDELISCQEILNAKLDNITTPIIPDAIAQIAQITSDFMTEVPEEYEEIMKNCVDHAKELTLIQTQLEKSKEDFNTLLNVRDEIERTLEVQEKKYLERIRECEAVTSGQSGMIDSMETLLKDLEGKMDKLINEKIQKLKQKEHLKKSHRRNKSSISSMASISSQNSQQSQQSQQSQYSQYSTTSFLAHQRQKSNISSLLNAGLFSGCKRQQPSLTTNNNNNNNNNHHHQSSQRPNHVSHYSCSSISSNNSSHYHHRRLSNSSSGSNSSSPASAIVERRKKQQRDQELSRLVINTNAVTSNASSPISWSNIKTSSDDESVVSTSELIPAHCLSPPHARNKSCTNPISLLTDEVRIRHQKRYSLAERWVEDDEVSACQQAGCSVTFNFWRRRHHCRRCGNIFCNEHSSESMLLFSDTDDDSSGVWSRVCEGCFKDN
ncbi:hypothetical protein Glove_326g140 [Diversispora epigaea]|uniref:FYVE-type domain-containing protein n=1 Tax=Diversispora epigaea TaxID=1348612 RepID=A0A397HMB4_9GLOM|nr:hypothetical protein Glove_326g140 [Diversispora epigaea]